MSWRRPGVSGRTLSLVAARARALSALLACAFAVMAGCGRGDIEETQRAWLDQQHRLEKRLLEVRADHDALMRRLAASSPVIGTETAARLSAIEAALRDDGVKLDRIDTLIDTHSLARDRAIRADDAEAVIAARAAASVDYESALSTLDSIDGRSTTIASELSAGVP